MMKRENDVFLATLYRKKSVKRRMLSLLLVLSLVVTSGVSWALRGVGMTMANEPECGIEEHVHTDTCYERQLICGLADDPEHTHTDECYADVLVCGMEEHIHDAGCYTASDTASLFSARSVTLDDATNEAGNIASDDESDYDGIDEADAGDTEDDGVGPLRAAGDGGTTGIHQDENGVYVVDTVDNIADGIHFTLFDYGDSNLESQLNHYGYWNNNGVFTHPNANTSSGINTGRELDKDILFLAYGTPVPYGTSDTPGVAGGTNVHNYIDDNGVHQYLPDMNSYSGDYNESTYYSGNRPVSGIVADDLPDDGYPVIATSRHSLKYLFAPDTTVDGVDMSAYKTVYPEVNHLLREEYSNQNVRYLKYDSNRNYAYYDQSTGNFIVYADDPNTTNEYEGTFDIVNDNHHAARTTNYHKKIKNDDGTESYVYYEEEKDPGFKIGFFPFDEYDNTRRDPNYDGDGYNHHFGMTMNAKFSNPENPTEPITFKYSGDDDMWVYVDGRLVLDIGGIHEPTSGMIDFTNGLVWVQDNGTGKLLSSDDPNEDTIEKQVAGMGKNLANLPLPIGINTAGTSVSEENRWIVTRIEDYFTEEKPWIPNKADGHEIKMFYLERGGCYSNLAMEMNLPTLKPLSVIKDVDYQKHLVKDQTIEGKEYQFRIYEWRKDTDGVYKWLTPLAPLDKKASFKLKDGERFYQPDLDQNKKYKIVEEGIDSNIYDHVTINASGAQHTTSEFDLGVITPGQDGTVSVNTLDANGNTPTLGQLNSYTFVNRVIEDDSTELKIKKVWICESDAEAAQMYTTHPIKYRILRSDYKDGVLQGEEKQVALKDDSSGKKQRIFTLQDPVNGDTKTGLLKQYGNHTYTYRIEELNPPSNYTVSYVDDGNGNWTLTNTKKNKTEMHVQKLWEHVPAGEEPEIKLQLKRKKTKVLGSDSTSLTVNILDEAGNLIQSETYTNVYEGGSTEIEYRLPQGCELYHYEGMEVPSGSTIDTSYPTAYPKKSPVDTLEVKFETGEDIFTVSNLSDGNNIVSFKVTTGYEQDDLLLVHHPYTRNTYNWGVQNDPSKQKKDAKVGNISDFPDKGYTSYAKGDAMIVYDREKSFNGATLKLDPAKFKSNGTYTFSTYVYYKGDTNYTYTYRDSETNQLVSGTAAVPDSIQFKFTFNDGLEKENNGSFQQISVMDVPKNTWTQLTGTITLPEDIDPYNMFIIVETGNPAWNSNDQHYEAPSVNEFLVDEFTAVTNETNVSVATDGKVSVGSTYYPLGTETNFVFNSDNPLPDGWSKNGNPSLEVQGGAIRVYNRYNNSDSIQRSFSSDDLIPGHTYRFELGAQHDGEQNNWNNPANNVHMILQYRNNNNNQYQRLCNMDLPDASNDHYLYANQSQTFTIPSTADLSNARIYFETENRNDVDHSRRSFRLRYLKITDITPLREIEVPTESNADGYTISNDPTPYWTKNERHYLTDYSNYILTQLEDTITNPQHLADTFSVETVEEVILNAANQWKYDWSLTELNEIHEVTEDYLYEYWVEEVEIIYPGTPPVHVSVNNPTYLICGLPESETHKHTAACWQDADPTQDILSDDDEYLVTYQGNFVASNTVETPIHVTNTAIWYRLPPTGGVGTDTIYGAGLVLILIGFTGGYAVKKRERRYK